jgi:hypothetical protein
MADAMSEWSQRAQDRRTVLRGLLAGAGVAAVGTTAALYWRSNGEPSAGEVATPSQGNGWGQGTAAAEASPTETASEAEGYEVIGEGSREVRVSDGRELIDAIAEAQPGSKIVLANGVYSYPDGFQIRGKRGTRDEGFTIEAEQTGEAVFVESASFLIQDCSHVVIRGIRHEGRVSAPGGAEFPKHAFTIHDSDHVRVTRNHIVMDDATGDEINDNDYVLFSGSSQRNRVDHCYFGPKTTIGTFIYIRMGDSGSQVCQYTTIDHNHFDRLMGEPSSQYEPVRLGHSDAQNSSAFTLFEYNLMTDCVADDEFISVKSSDNVIRYNTFRAMFGALVLRNGNRTDVYGNFWFGEGRDMAGGITVNDGTGHRLWNNYLSGLTSEESNRPGGIIFEVLDYAEDQVTDCVFVHNSIIDCARPVQLGRDRGAGYPYQPVGITVANNLIVGAETAIEEGGAQDVMLEGNVERAAGEGWGGLVRTSSGLLAPGAGSALADAAVGRWAIVTDDALGRRRTAPAAVGALEDDSGAATRRPLTAADVGPLS